MKPLIKSGEDCKIIPVVDQWGNYKMTPIPGDAVLCTVRGTHYVHKILGAKAKPSGEFRYLIGNNRGGVNGWTSAIHGIVTEVEGKKLKRFR